MERNEKKKNKTDRIKIFVEDHGYFFEDHQVTTADGYILHVRRLLKRDNSPIDESDNFKNLTLTDTLEKQQSPRPVVLLVHGLLCRGESWCATENSLPKLLLEKGYDCWLPSLRGTSESRRHVKLPSNSKKYWDFSFHEMGVFDMPAIINYVLDITGNTNLSYIGHSMGCSVFFICLSMCPEYCSKINVCVALAPSFYGQYIRSFLLKSTFPVGSYLGKNKFFRERPICKWTAYQWLRYLVPKSKRDRVAGWLIRISGRIVHVNSSKGTEKKTYRTVSTELPNSTSMKLYCHGVQCFWGNKFKMYDYGRSENMKIYGQSKPPEYPCENISTPVATFASTGDYLCPPPDVKRLSDELPSLIGYNCIENEKFSHGDFLLGKNAPVLLYDSVIKTIAEFTIK